MRVNTISNGFVETTKENHWVLNDSCIRIHLKLNIVTSSIQYTTGFFCQFKYCTFGYLNDIGFRRQIVF